MHLRDDEHRCKSEEEHRPDLLAGYKRHGDTMHEDRDLKRHGPPFVGVNASEYEGPLQEQQEGVEEAQKVARRGFHRVEPIGVGHSPGEIIAVIADKHGAQRFQPAASVAEEKAAARGFDHQHDNQEEDHRNLRGKHRGVLRQTVIPDRRLKIMQADEGEGANQADPVHGMHPAPITQLLAMPHGPPDQTPEEELMREIEAPGGGAARPVGVDPLPVIPGRALIRQVRHLIEEGLKGQNGERRKNRAEKGGPEDDPEGRNLTHKPHTNRAKKWIRNRR